MPTTKLPPGPSPSRFAETFRAEVLKPAADKVAGPDGNIDASDASAAMALSGKDILARQALLDGAAASAAPVAVGDFVQAATQRALDAARTAAGPDGRLSAADAQALPTDLRVAFHFLRTGELDAAALGPPPLTVPERPGVRFSEAVFREVAAAYGLTDGAALLDKALAMGDGSAYVNRSELEAAAEALRQASSGGGAPSDPVTDPPVSDAPAGLAFSESVLARVMADFGVADRGGLLEVATRHDLDGNRYLKRSELEAAARELTGQGAGSFVDVGIVSDVDKTLLPPHADGAALPPPYPGVTLLIALLEKGEAGTGQDGDMHYVTARSPDRVTDLPGWFDAHGLPAGSLDTGINTMPWVAQNEKVADIARLFDAEPNKRFVLFGDSSHRDPEVYKEILARYPDRVIAGFIHKVNNPSPGRTEGLHLVTSYAEAAAILFGKGLLSEASARAVMVKAQAEGLTITDAEMNALIAQHRPH